MTDTEPPAGCGADWVESEIPPISRRAEQPDLYAPDGSEIRLLTDGRHGAVKSSVVEVTLPAGQVSRPVYHRTVEETWYILEGRGKVWRCPPGMVSPELAEGSDHDAALADPQDVSQGDALVIPTGWRFQFAASPEAELRFLCHTTPPWPGEDEAVPAERGGLGAPTV